MLDTLNIAKASIYEDNVKTLVRSALPSLDKCTIYYIFDSLEEQVEVEGQWCTLNSNIHGD